MNRNAYALIAAGAILLGALVLPGQSSAREWHLTRRGGDRVRFTISRYSPGHRVQISNDVPLDRFRGLTFANGSAKFEYVQDAGRLVCEGRFFLGAGSGTFTAVLDPDFVSELARLGYDTPNEDQMFDLLVSGFSLDFARAVKDAGLDATTAQLIDMRNHGIDTGYIREIRASGYRNLEVRDYIDFRNHGVAAAFLADLKRSGYEISAREVIDLRNHGVGGDFVRELKTYGLHPDAADLVTFRNHGIGADYLKALKDAGYPDLNVAQIVDLRNHGVPAAFLRDTRALGYDFSVPELIGLRNHGVDGAYLRRLKDSGMRNLTAGKIEKLKDHGID